METPEGPTVRILSTLPADVPDAHGRIPAWSPENRSCEDRKPGRRLRAACEVLRGEDEFVLCCEHLQTATYRSPVDFEGRAELKSERKPS